jgi:hypothetical protein
MNYRLVKLSIVLAIALLLIASSNRLRSVTEPAARASQLSPLAPTQCQTPTDMLGLWKAEGNSNDSAGPSFENGIYQGDDGAGDPEYSAGFSGQSFDFDGINDRVEVAGIPSQTQVSVDAWIFIPAGTPVNDIYGIISRYRSLPGERGFELYVDNGKLQLRAGDATGTQTDARSANSINFGQWTHVAATIDANECRVYINGNLEGTGPGLNDINTTSYNLFIGTREAAYESVFYFRGLIDEAELFTRALSAAEIQNIYQAGNCGSPTPTPSPTVEPNCVTPPGGMVSWWTGDSDAKDFEGINNGTTQGSVSYTQGMVGQAFSLNGVDAYINAGNAASLQVSSGDFTIDAWVNFNVLSHPPGANNGAPAGDMSIIDKMSQGGVNTDGWRLLKQNDNRFWFCLGAGSNQCGNPAYTLFSQTQAVTGQWYHVAVVKTYGSFSIYVNGVLEDTRALPGFVDSNSADLLIGANALEWARLNGLVDEVELFSRALSGAEIQSVYNAGSAGKCKTVPDTTPPETFILAGPAEGSVVGSGNSIFSFTGTDDTTLSALLFYECSLDGAAFSICTSPASYTSLADGTHTFAVRAVDADGNIDQTPASLTWTVSTAPPTPSYNICALYDQTKAHRAGTPVAVKLQLCDAGGFNLSSSAIVVTALQVVRISDNAVGPVEDQGNANPDFNFRYDAALGGTGGYIFNLSTKGMVTGTYLLGFTAGNDPALHTVQFKVR